MPHPERCAEEILGNTDGLAIFAGALATLPAGQTPPRRLARQEERLEVSP